MYVAPCSTMLGTEKGRIVDGRWGYRVARSRNEICVTRGPTSPGLRSAITQFSSARRGSVLLSGRVARYIIQLCHSSYTHGPTEGAIGTKGADRTNEEEKDRKRYSHTLFSYTLVRAGNVVFASKCGATFCFKDAAIMKL